jgi:peptide chain release factor subunit 1
MSIDAKSKEVYEFKKQLKALESYRGRGTELITVYITPGYQISDIMGKLKEEAGQATNIKSTGTRNNVTDALAKIIAYLKNFKTPPQNGMAIFCGNVSETEGKPDIQLFSIEPPAPLHVQFYRCESIFVLDPLRELIEHEGAYGLVVMDGKEATVAVLRGKNIKVIKQIHSTAHAKTHKGGQSAARFQRLREEGIEWFQERIGEAMNAFLEVKGFKGVIAGGPGPAKEDFIKAKPFNYQLKILAVVDTGYTDEYGLRELLDKAGEVISEQESVVEKKLVAEFMSQAARGGAVVYGYDAVKQAIEANQAKQVLVTENQNFYKLDLQCSACNFTSTMTSTNNIFESDCPNCKSGKLRSVKSTDLINELIGMAEDRSVPVEMISNETSEGEQFAGGFHGIGAFLRYK